MVRVTQRPLGSCRVPLYASRSTRMRSPGVEPVNVGAGLRAVRLVVHPALCDQRVPQLRRHPGVPPVGGIELGDEEPPPVCGAVSAVTEVTPRPGRGISVRDADAWARVVGDLADETRLVLPHQIFVDGTDGGAGHLTSTAQRGKRRSRCNEGCRSVGVATCVPNLDAFPVVEARTWVPPCRIHCA